MHPLVQFCSRSWTAVNGSPERWGQLVLDFVLGQFDSRGGTTLEACERLLRHLLLFPWLLSPTDKSLSPRLIELQLLRMQHWRDMLNSHLAMFGLFSPRAVVRLGKTLDQWRRSLDTTISMIKMVDSLARRLKDELVA